MKKKSMSGLESLWYYTAVILSCGFWYTIKVVIKKAILDSQEE